MLPAPLAAIDDDFRASLDWLEFIEQLIEVQLERLLRLDRPHARVFFEAWRRATEGALELFEFRWAEEDAFAGEKLEPVVFAGIVARGDRDPAVHARDADRHADGRRRQQVAVERGACRGRSTFP
jgi:hypothetical protein